MKDKVTGERLFGRQINELLVDRVNERQSNRRTIDFRILLSFKFSIAFVRTRGFVNKILIPQMKRALIGFQLTPFWLTKDALLKSK